MPPVQTRLTGGGDWLTNTKVVTELAGSDAVKEEVPVAVKEERVARLSEEDVWCGVTVKERAPRFARL